jgi:hypothetical protein
MLGGLTCPHCMNTNACPCSSCLPHILEGEPVARLLENDMILCDCCGKLFSHNDAFMAEGDNVEIRTRMNPQFTPEEYSSFRNSLKDF